MRTLVFLDGISEKIKKRVTHLKDDAIFITSDTRTFISLKEMGLNVRFTHDLFSKEDIERADSECRMAAHESFVSDGRDYSFYHGLSYGLMSEFFLVPAFGRTYRHILSVKRAVEDIEHDSIVVAGECDMSRMARHVLGQMQIPFDSWSDGKRERLRYVLRKLWEGKKNGWVASSIRDLIVEPVQNLIVIARAVLRQKEKVDSGRKYLFFSGDSHMYPFYEQLRKSGEWGFMVLGMHFRYRREFLADVMPIEGYLSMGMIFRSAVSFIHFLRTWMKIKSDIRFREKFSFLGVNYWDRIKPALKRHMLITFPRLYLNHLTADEAFKHYPSKRSVLLVFSDQPPVYRTAVYTARGRGVKSVELQHGILAAPTINDTIKTDYYAAYGENAIDAYGRPFGDTDKITISGAPRYDEYAITEGLDRERILNELGLPSDKKIVLVLTQWMIDLTVSVTAMEDLMMVDNLINALQRPELKDTAHVVVKPHPTGDVDLLRDFLGTKMEAFPHLTIIEGRLKELLYVADLCISGYSSVVLEAMFFKKPSVIFDHYTKNEIVPYVSRGAALDASDADEMAFAVNALLTDKGTVESILKKQKEFIEYAAYKQDGFATKRMIQLINMIAGGEKLPKCM